MPSVVYSKFVQVRLEALDLVVQGLSAFRPRLPNHVTLSGLVSYLLQSLMSTPVMVPTFVRQCLTELGFGSNVARFGLFFLSDLDLDNPESLGLPIGDTSDDLERDCFNTIRDANITLGSQAPKVCHKLSSLRV